MIKQYQFNEMLKNCLWEKYWDELYGKAVKEVKKDVGFWKCAQGVNEKIKDRHWELFCEKFNKWSEKEKSRIADKRRKM
jgi:hypothetical protein